MAEKAKASHSVPERQEEFVIKPILKDGDILAEILATGICRPLGKDGPYLTIEIIHGLGIDINIGGWSDFGHTVAWLSFFRSKGGIREYCDDGSLLQRWSTYGPIIHLIQELNLVNQLRREARLRDQAMQNLINKRLLPTGRRISKRDHFRCIKSAQRAREKATKRLHLVSPKFEISELFEALFNGGTLPAASPERDKAEKEIESTFAAEEKMRRNWLWK